MYIFDTSIISYVLRRDPLAALYHYELEANEPLFISCQTIGEIRYGAAKKNWGQGKMAKVSRLIDKFAVLPLDTVTAELYGDIRAAADSLGRPLLSQDAWILATSKQYKLTVVSHDGDMLIGSEVGIKIIRRK